MRSIDLKVVTEMKSVQKPYKIDIVWRNVVLMSLLHLAAIYGAVLYITDCKYITGYYAFIILHCSGFGILCGAHRLWSHQSYKAKLPMKIILAIWETMALQNDIYEWVRDHRMHHKYLDTNGDPHNATRGFFFGHIGWLLIRKHPDIIEKGKSIDMSDLDKDPIIQFQRNYYIPMVILFWAIIPTVVPYYFWDEKLITSIFVCVILRCVIVLNISWAVNSVAHRWGVRPYDKNITPTECYIAKSLMNGEGFHNFHHTFPWDYTASEHSASEVYNPSTVVINIFEKLGWAYDLKTASPTLVKNKMKKTGDITYTKSSIFEELVLGTLVSNSYSILLLIIKIFYNYKMIKFN